MTLRTKLLLWYSGVFFFSATLLVTAMYFLITHKTRKEFFHYFRDEYEETQRIIKEHSDDTEELERAVEVEVHGKKFFPLSYELYDVRTGRTMLSMAPRGGTSCLPCRRPDKWAMGHTFRGSTSVMIGTMLST